jgi:hypothetical protein
MSHLELAELQDAFQVREVRDYHELPPGNKSILRVDCTP